MKQKITVRTYNVYDHNNQLISSYNDLSDLIKGFDIKSTTNIYKSAKDESYFKANKNDSRFIRVEVIKEKKELEVETKTIKTYPVLQKRNSVETLEGEEWREVPGFPGNWCSNLGRFKFEKDGVNTTLASRKAPNRTKRLYRDIVLIKVADNDEIEGSEYFRASRILAKTWLDDTLDLRYKKGSKMYVDHIDNNPDNEKIENLRILTASGNIKAAIYEQGREVGRPIKKCYAYNINTKEIREYESTKTLVQDIWGKNNAGYFKHAEAAKSTTKSGWRVGYNLEDLKAE